MAPGRFPHSSTGAGLLYANEAVMIDNPIGIYPTREWEKVYRNIYQEDVPDGVFPPLYTHISYQTGSGKMIYPKNHSFYHYPYPPLYLLQSFPFYFVL